MIRCPQCLQLIGVSTATGVCATCAPRPPAPAPQPPRVVEATGIRDRGETLRCATCGYLVSALLPAGVCAVCTQQAPVTQLPRDVQTPWDIGTSMRGLFTPGRQKSPPPIVPRDAPRVAPRQVYPCEMPGCDGSIDLSVQGRKQLQTKGRPVRCRACYRGHRTAWQADYHARVRPRKGGA